MTSAPGPAEIARLHELLATLPEAADVEPGSASAFAFAARSALQLGRPDDAIVLGRAALTLAPDNAPAWTAVGDGLWSLGQVHDARVAYETAIGLDDKDLTTALACARAQHRDGALEAARALLNFVLLKSRSIDITKAAAELRETLS